MFFITGRIHIFLLWGGYMVFMLWADTLLSYFGQGAFFLRRGGRVFSASGKAHCFPASGGRHSFNLGGAQGLSCFGRGAFLFWGMAYCFRPRRCALVNPCAYEGLPRLRNRSARVSFVAVRRVRRLYVAPRAASCGRCRGRWRACVLCAPP